MNKSREWIEQPAQPGDYVEMNLTNIQSEEKKKYNRSLRCLELHARSLKTTMKIGEGRFFQGAEIRGSFTLEKYILWTHINE